MKKVCCVAACLHDSMSNRFSGCDRTVSVLCSLSLHKTQFEMLHQRNLLYGVRHMVKGRFRSTQRAHISFEQSLRMSNFPAINVTSNSSSDADTLIMTIVKSNHTDEEAAKHVVNSIHGRLSPGLRDLISECIADGSFVGDDKEKYVIRVPREVSCGYKHVVLLGVGSEANNRVFKSVGKLLPTIAKELKAPHLALISSEVSIRSVMLGVEDASYDDKRYKGAPDEDNTSPPSVKTVLETISFTNVPSESEVSAATLAHRSRLTSIGVNIAKDLVGAPPNAKTPVAIAEYARAIAAQSENMSCTILGQEECEERNMGGFLAVQQGSKFPPQLVHLVYKNKFTRSGQIKKIAIVGKGLTFDSGGYNLKVGAGSMIEMMKFDMGGLGAVLGAASAISAIDSASAASDSAPTEGGRRLLDGVEVHFISAVCENMISRDAMRPGDVVTASNGKTIEIINTDAEGRLTLADALVYADRTVGADVIVDLATLTGASMVALGENVGSLFGSGDRVVEDLTLCAQKSGDQLWHMPLHDEYKDNIKSKIADIKNIGDGKAGSITAALFLQEFVRDGTEWAHVDMAGPVWDNGTHKPTGYGVKLLVEYILHQASMVKKA